MSYILGFIKQNENNFKIEEEDGYKYLLTLQGEGAWETSNSNITDGEMEIHHQGGSASPLHLSENESYLMFVRPGFGVAIVMISEDRIYMCDAEGTPAGIAGSGGTYYSIAPKKFEFNKNLADLLPKEAYYIIDYNTNKLNTFIIKKIKK